MTSITEATHPRPAFPALRVAFLLVGLLLGSSVTPWPWAALWWVVPMVVAASLLLAWRHGAGAWGVTAVLIGVAVFTVMSPDTGIRPWHVMWLPLAAVTGTWMGLREEGGGPSLGERAWMHVPLLLGAFLLPVTPGLHDTLVRFEARTRVEEQQVLQLAKGEKSQGLIAMIEESAKLSSADRVRMLEMSLPNLAFLGMVLLVAAGRALAGHLALMRGWPRMSHAPWSGWRLPDLALLPLLAGLALWLLTFHPSAASPWAPGTVFLLLQSALGYSVQGFAVIGSRLSAHDARPLTMVILLFVLLFTLPVSLMLLPLIGLSDVWLDHRRLEPSPRGEA